MQVAEQHAKALAHFLSSIQLLAKVADKDSLYCY